MKKSRNSVGSKKMKVVYVTGCLGFIGSYVTRQCLDLGWYVRGIDKMTYAANQDLLKEFETYDNFVFEKIDINDIEFLYDCDYVINTAAETHVGNSIVCSDCFVSSNIKGVHHLLELIRNFRQEGKDVPVLFHFSTDEVYGDIGSGSHTEDDLLMPSNPYSATKASADMLVLAWARTYGIPYILLRPTNNYGIGQYIEKLVPKTCKYIGLGRKIPLHNDGLPVRNWLHADDTASAVVQIISADVVNEIYNVAGGFEQQNIATVTKILRAYDKLNKQESNIQDFLDLSASRPGQDVRYALNDRKLKNLGWSPKRHFDSEIQNIVDYYRDKFIW